MNKVVWGAVALAVVAGGGVGATAWSGAKVTQELHDHTAAALGQFPAVKVIDHQTRKGLFSSTHDVTLQVGCTPTEGAAQDGTPQPLKPMQITWRDHIQHGPLPGGRTFGLAIIQSELVLPPEAAAQLAKVMGQKTPLNVRTVLGYGGGYVSEISSPAFTYPYTDTDASKGRMAWQGIQAEVRGNLQQGLSAGSRYSLNIPGLTFTLPKTEQGNGGSFKLGRIESSGETSPHPQANLWMQPGKASGSIASAEFRFDRPVEGGPSQPMTVLVDGVKFSSEASLDNGLLSASSQLSAKARLDDFAIDKLEMKVSLRHLHADTYQKFMGRFVSAAMSCDRNAQAALQESLMTDLQKDLATLLQQNPEYGLDKLAVEIGGKRAELSYKVGIRGVTAQDAQAPAAMLVMSKGYAHANGSVQTGLIEHVIKYAAALQAKQAALHAPGAASAPNAQAAPAHAASAAAAERAADEQAMMAMVNQLIDEGVAKGYVVREGDSLKAAAKFENGQLLVNGKPLMQSAAAPAEAEPAPAQ